MPVMSEPLSNHEIEDVVSSIRRLVSTEPRQKTRDLGHDKLLLTPALRVVQEAVAPEPVMTAPVLPEAVMPEAATGEPEVAEALVAEPLVLAEAVVETAAVAEPVVETADVAEAVVETADVAEVVEAADVAEETFVAGSVTPEGEALVEEIIAERVAEPEVPLDAPMQVIDAEWEDEIWEEPEQTLSEIADAVEDAELVAEAEALFSVMDDPVPFHAHPRPFAPQPEPVAVAPVAEAPAVLDEPAEAEPDYAMVDEDVLHEIVRDLIREELQGALGERITRNVRKLVRAEINRALASRAYE